MTDIVQLEITIGDLKPTTLRRVQVHHNTTLASLHDIIQIAFDWEDYHMHMFEVGGQNYGSPSPEAFMPLHNEAFATLKSLGLKKGHTFTYEYDFGDSWRHEINVERLIEPEEDATYPRCIEAKRAAPPEDSGGAWGYQYKLDVLADEPDSEEAEEIRAWMPPDFDPAYVDVDRINQQLSRLKVMRLTPDEIPTPEEIDAMDAAIGEFEELVSREEYDELNLMFSSVILRSEVNTSGVSITIPALPMVGLAMGQYIEMVRVYLPDTSIQITIVEDFSTVTLLLMPADKGRVKEIARQFGL